ncbi:MAG: MBL fold metallo-hydrolase [Candidatus Kryptoniota bacterium]
MKITVLGSGSAYSDPSRFNSCYLVETQEGCFIIDCGSDALRAFQKYKVDMFRIQKIFLTHMHADHAGGLPAVLTAMQVMRRWEPLQVFVPKSQIDFVSLWLSNMYIFPQRMGFDIGLYPIVDLVPSVFNGIKVNFVPSSHLIKYSDYAGRLNLGMESFSIFLQENGHGFYYTGDIESFSEVKDFLDQDLVFVDSTHLSLDDISLLAGAERGNVAFTHVPQELEEGGAWRKELQARLGIQHLNLVYDGQTFEL